MCKIHKLVLNQGNSINLAKNKMATGYPAGNGIRRQSNGSVSPDALTQHYGMHSFQTAGQMQQYIEQIAGEGATVNVTHAVRNTTSRRSFGSGSSIAQP